MTARLAALVATLALLALVLTVGRVEAYTYTVADTHAAIAQVEPAYRGWVEAIVACETAHTYDPYATNWDDEGYGPSRGVTQINDTLQRWHFEAQGYTDPYSPYESVQYLTRALRGEFAADGITYRRWSCA